MHLCNIYTCYRDFDLVSSVTVMEDALSTHCWTCLAPFMPKRKDARYCSVACRVRAYRLAMSPAARAKARVLDAKRHRVAYAARFAKPMDKEASE